MGPTIKGGSSHKTAISGRFSPKNLYLAKEYWSELFAQMPPHFLLCSWVVSSHVDPGLGHVSCSHQRDNSQCDTITDLNSSGALGLALSVLWGPEVTTWRRPGDRKVRRHVEKRLAIPARRPETHRSANPQSWARPSHQLPVTHERAQQSSAEPIQEKLPTDSQNCELNKR